MSQVPPPELPVDAALPELAARLAERRAVVVVAEPGAGKTTRVPPFLVRSGAAPLVLLQPRRVAARSLAARIAAEQGWSAGEEVGWQVRFENRSSPRTRLLVVTEGILTRRLQSDPLLSDFRVVVLDEFHERSLHADLALALVKQAWRARDDLWIVVMSATLDAEPVCRFLEDCPLVRVPGRTHPIAISYRPGASVPAAAREVLAAAAGDVLAFLPGAGEIRAAGDELGSPAGVDVLPLHGSLEPEAQSRVLVPGPRRKLILATNLAETSLTIEGVTDVIDSGLAKVLRYDVARGLDRLETERITADSAEQRAGRAGRTGPGRALRLWDARDRLHPHREPELQRVDLASPLLEVSAWGGDVRTFEWFEAPPAEAVAAGLELLRALGALEGDPPRLSALGERLRRLPLHPRLGRLLLEAGGARRAAEACALLAERHGLRLTGETTRSDLLSLLDRFRDAPWAVRRAARDVQELAGGNASDDDDRLLRAVLAAFPDRVARRRAPGSPRVLLASGQGGLLAQESGVREAEFLVALEVTAGERGRDPLVRLASAIERDWLAGDRREVVHELDAGQVRALAREWHRGLVLSERAVAPDAETAARLLAGAWAERGLREENAVLLRRAAFAEVAVDVPSLLLAACYGETRLVEKPLRGFLDPAAAAAVDRLAPETIEVPSGRRVRLEYREDGGVQASVKLQELFGLAETPRVGPRRVPVLLALLAPSGRPVQMTTDLRSFWERTYPEVRKELRGRYPKHPWPDDPWSAEPTARAKRRS